MRAITGAFEKGPFVLGSSVSVSGLDDVWSPTGSVFQTQTTSDLGEFSVTAELPPRVSIEGSGFYYNEALRGLSTSPITLRALHEFQEPEETVFVNLVTHLTYHRIRGLLADGVEFAEAVVQAEEELRAGFGIGPEDLSLAEHGVELNLMGGNTLANAYLFAVSSVLTTRAQLGGGSVDAALQELMNKISSDLEGDGKLDTETVSGLEVAEQALDTFTVKRGLEQRIEALGVGTDVPDLDLIIDSDLDGVVNADDNCLRTPNDQADSDGDGVGDECDFEFIQVSDGGEMHCGVTTDEEILCWDRATGAPSPWMFFDPSASDLPEPPTGPWKAIAVDSTWLGACGLRNDGTVECWGETTLAPSLILDDIGAGRGMFCGRRPDGSAVTWTGEIGEAATIRADVVGPFSQVDVQQDVMCGIHETGDTVGCYYRSEPATDDYVGPSGVFTFIDLGRTHGCGVRDDGTIECWGADHTTVSDQDLSGTDFVRVTTKDFGTSGDTWQVLCGLRATGNVSCWSDHWDEGQQESLELIPFDTTFIEISMSFQQLCGLDADGRMGCWGSFD